MGCEDSAKWPRRDLLRDSDNEEDGTVLDGLVANEKELGSVQDEEQCVPKMAEGDVFRREDLALAGSVAVHEGVSPLCGITITRPSTPSDTMTATEMNCFEDIEHHDDFTSSLHGLSMAETAQMQEDVNERDDWSISDLDGAYDDATETVVGDDAATTVEQLGSQVIYNKRKGRAAKRWIHANELVSYARLQPSPRSSLEEVRAEVDDEFADGYDM